MFRICTIRSQRRAGFTLIELLVVIAIIAILAAILFPVFAQAKAAAKTSATISNVKQVDLAVQMYSNDNDDGTPMYESSVADPPGHVQLFAEIVYPYVKNANVFYDAATGIPPEPLKTSGDWGFDPVNWVGWTADANISLNGGGLFGYWVTADSSYHYGRVLSSQDKLSERAMLMTTSDPDRGDPYGNYQFLNWTCYSPDYNDPTDYWANLTYNAIKRHRDGNVVGYGDGHAGRVAAGKIYVPKGVDPGTFWQNSPNVQAFWGYWWSPTE